MITISSAENALKTVYLDTITDLLNSRVNPLLAKFEQTSIDVAGKEIRKAVRASIDGGVGAGDETSDLPSASITNYLQYVISLKNLYGQIEISDKSIRASSDTKGAFTNLLNQSLDGLLESSRFNLSRMLFGNGSGFLINVRQDANPAGTFTVVGAGLNCAIEGMVVDMYTLDGELFKKSVQIVSIDRFAEVPTVVLDIAENVDDVDEIYVLYMQGSKDKEITGLGAIFDVSKPLYGLDRTKHRVLNPYIDLSSKKVSDILFSSVVDRIESYTSSTIDYIACASNVKLAYQHYLSSYKRNIDIMELNGGYKSISFNGIPVVSEKFVNNNYVYFLDTTAFKIHQLCDWQFIESENGRVLRQTQGKPTYSATLVKYCDLVCDKPNGQAMLKVDATIE
ncbi:MAG: phage major capsid protein [Firmicutes bacterium]|nr:phage major capsid protein [Bacillota bacterium]